MTLPAIKMLKDLGSIEGDVEPDALSISDILVALGAVRPAVSRDDVLMGRQWAYICHYLGRKGRHLQLRKTGSNLHKDQGSYLL